MLSESTGSCRRYDKNILVWFLSVHSVVTRSDPGSSVLVQYVCEYLSEIESLLFDTSLYTTIPGHLTAITQQYQLMLWLRAQ